MPKHQIRTALGKNRLKFSSSLWMTISCLLKPQILCTTFTHRQGSDKTLQPETVNCFTEAERRALQEGTSAEWTGKSTGIILTVPIWDIPVWKALLPFLCSFSPTTHNNSEQVSLGYETLSGVTCFSVQHHSKYHKHLLQNKVIA